MNNISKIIIDLTNQRFGRLTVLHRTENPNNKKKMAFWLCKCDCGNTTITNTNYLKSGKTTQCGDCGRKEASLKRRKDLTGKKFGKLTVIKMIYGNTSKTGKHYTYCECKCDCGNIIIKNAHTLRENSNVLYSCGCARKEIADKLSIDVVGKKFGRLTVIEELKEFTPRKVVCRCDCGNIVTKIKTEITSYETRSCGCLARDLISERSTKDWTNHVSDYGVKAMKQHSKNAHGQWLWEYQCPICKNTFVSLPAWVNSGKVTSCGCKIQSTGEKLIKKYLDDNLIDYIPQYSTHDCKYKSNLRFDFALVKNGQPYYFIEYQGKQHYEPVEFFGGEEQFLLNQKRDNIKREYCDKNNIPLLELKYTLSNKEIKENIANIIYP